MDEMERRQHLLHAQLPAFQRKVDWSRQLIDDAFAHAGIWYLAFSGGIDSTVLLHLLREAGYRGPILWGDDGADYPETLTFLAEAEQRCQARIQRIRCLDPWRDWCEEMNQPDLADDPAAQDAWINPCTWDATWRSLAHDAHAHGYSGVFLGMMAKESRSRQYALHNGYKTLYQVKSEDGMWHCSPLAAWDKRDIWAYAATRCLSYNPVYDRLAAIGVPLERRRVAPLTCFRTVQYGSVVHLRVGWPALYARLSTLFPSTRAYS